MKPSGMLDKASKEHAGNVCLVSYSDCVAPEVGGDKNWADWRKHCTTGQVTWKLNQN